MTALVRCDDKYIASYNLIQGQFKFKWTDDLSQADEMEQEFAVMVARMVGGKTIPVEKR